MSFSLTITVLDDGSNHMILKPLSGNPYPTQLCLTIPHTLSLCVSVMIQLLYITAKNTLTDCTESIVGTARHFSHLYSLAEFALGEF